VAAAAARLAAWARSIRRDVRAVYLASRDPRTPWYAKALAIGVAAYALSPIDLIPDFIPILGQLDEAIILPLGIWLVVRMIPPEVMAEHRRAAAVLAEQTPRSMAGAVAIVAIWVLLAAGTGWLAYRWLWP
jgi:uncharacterized membrane protein YkvA (DUF1232 family)